MADAVIDLTQDGPANVSGTVPQSSVTWSEGRVVVYTDGASRDNQHRAIRRAGVGVFWAVGHPYNVGEPLRGASQTNNRAELTAVIRALHVSKLDSPEPQPNTN